MRDAASELGMPSRLGTTNGRFGGGRTGRSVESALDWFGWFGGVSVTQRHMSQFEASFSPLLLGFQLSPYWLYQSLQYQRKRRKIDWHYSPVAGPYQSAFAAGQQQQRDDESVEEDV